MQDQQTTAEVATNGAIQQASAMLAEDTLREARRVANDVFEPREKREAARDYAFSAFAHMQLRPDDCRAWLGYDPGHRTGIPPLAYRRPRSGKKRAQMRRRMGAR